ncbi:hypothetical protein MKX03_029450 [Papaver bracteatum]|nr:hypothetical protein MKX03_029450 [Papaver bracteatum]
MATKPKDTSHGKEKIGSSSSPSNHETTHGRTSRLANKSSIPTSPDKVHGTLSEKSTPNYLKHTLSSSKETSGNCKLQHAKKPATGDTSNPKFLRRKSFDKPPSPATLQRTLSSNSSKEKTPMKVSSPTPKTVISPRPILERKTISPKPVAERTSISSKPVFERTSSAKTLRNVKPVQPAPAKTRTLRRSSSSTSSRTSRSSPAPSVGSNTAPTSPETTETPSHFKVEQEDKVILEHEVPEQEILKVEDEEEIPFEIPPDHDQVLIDHHVEYSDSPTNIGMENETILDTPKLEEQEQEQEELVTPTAQIEEAQERTIEPVPKENQHEDEEKDEQDMVDNKDIEESSNNQIQDNQETESGEQVEPEPNVEEGEDETTVKPTIHEKLAGSNGENSEDNKPFKMKFKQAKELELEAQDVATPQKLKFKERDTQDAKGKKETQAYNDVIEETASKLVEKKKNKVLALAGAFETVISLQETEGQSRTRGG